MFKGSQDTWKLSVAPMMAWTDRHCRRLHRLVAPKTRLYTEMLTTGALLHSDPDRLLRYSAEEKPLALQLGGSNPSDLAKCSEMAQKYGFDEVNLNIGCPSNRVQQAAIGACLMNQPELVAQCVNSMRSHVDIPITVKCRTGIDDQDSFEFLERFISSVAQTGVSVFIIHARKAILTGLTPAQNRHAPPLNYERVYKIKQKFPELTIILNGGIQTVQQTLTALQHTDGVMLGRAAYQNPLLLPSIEKAVFGGGRDLCAEDVLEEYLPYIKQELASGTRLHSITRHMLSLFNGLPGAKYYRRHLSENARLTDAGEEILFEAVQKVHDIQRTQAETIC